MAGIVDIIQNSYEGEVSYLLKLVTQPSWNNYLYWFLGLSAFFFLLEIVKPWRKNQPKFRKDFWLDFFYMFFNLFFFSLIIYKAGSDIVVHYLNETLASIGINNLVAFKVMSWPVWAHLLIGFVVRDFVQWWVHRLLHRSEFLWEFHKVHHSVEQMGFAAHLRYHWMEPIVYKALLYIPIAIIGGFNAQDVAIVHFFALAVGHLNHANLGWSYGPLKYIINNPKMHIWHHAKEFPEHVKFGVNFGLTLSVWDYIFKTNYIPYDGRDIELGFEGDETFPQDFISQEIYPLNKK